MFILHECRFCGQILADFGGTPKDPSLIDNQIEYKIFRKMQRHPVKIKMIYLGKAMKEFLVIYLQIALHDYIRKCW